jgi:hypothetical protein
MPKSSAWVPDLFNWTDGRIYAGARSNTAPVVGRRTRQKPIRGLSSGPLKCAATSPWVIESGGCPRIILVEQPKGRGIVFGALQAVILLAHRHCVIFAYGFCNGILLQIE